MSPPSAYNIIHDNLKVKTDLKDGLLNSETTTSICDITTNKVIANNKTVHSLRHHCTTIEQQKMDWHFLPCGAMLLTHASSIKQNQNNGGGAQWRHFPTVNSIFKSALHVRNAWYIQHLIIFADLKPCYWLLLLWLCTYTVCSSSSIPILSDMFFSTPMVPDTSSSWSSCCSAMSWHTHTSTPLTYVTLFISYKVCCNWYNCKNINTIIPFQYKCIIQHLVSTAINIGVYISMKHFY